MSQVYTFDREQFMSNLEYWLQLGIAYSELQLETLAYSAQADGDGETEAFYRLALDFLRRREYGVEVDFERYLRAIESSTMLVYPVDIAPFFHDLRKEDETGSDDFNDDDIPF